MTITRPSRVSLALLLLAAAAPPPAAAQISQRAWGRIALFGTAATVTPEGGEARSLNELVTQATYHSPEDERQKLEFAVDSRFAGYPQSGRVHRTNLFEAWAGTRLAHGHLLVRGGQFWITEVGGLGAVAGGLVEYRRGLGSGTLRVAGFGGREPQAFDLGLVPDVTRVGGHVTFEGPRGRRHTAGVVELRNAGLSERSVVTTTNFMPVGTRVFVYQAAEYDLHGPAGQQGGGLTYLFANGRVSPTTRIDLQGTYHRGRSIDTRTITLDQLNGRPIPTGALDGLLYESFNGRVVVEVVRGLRIYGGGGQDRTDRDAEPTSRLNAGVYVNDSRHTGLDATVTWNRFDRGAPGSFDSWYVSVGRNLTSRVYLSGDYSSSLSIVRFTRSDGVTIETRPETTRVGGTAIVNLSRVVSLLVVAEFTQDTGADERRVLTGLTWRLPEMGRPPDRTPPRR